MDTIKSSPVLQSTTRTGAAKFWQGHVVTDGTRWFTQTSYWQVNKAGTKSAVQFSEPYEAKPKNVGKANATTAEAQALFELDSIVNKQMDKKYLPEGHTAKEDDFPLPMLAQKYSEKSHKINFPCYVQPKLNGMRMVFNGKRGQSRGGKAIIPEVIQHLLFNNRDGTMLDGELILPNNVLLQKTMSSAKKFNPETSPTLLYCVYDAIIEDAPFTERLAYLTQMDAFRDSHHLPVNIHFVETYEVNNEEEIKKCHKQFTKAGYEGTIIRNANGVYQVNQRSSDLQKYKDMVDAEFEIVDVVEGDGQYKGCAIFVCKTKDGVEFNCNPEGTIQHKQELYRNRKKLISQWLTIRFQELSADLVPLFPVGVDVREKGDF